jgi:hypothetical protein
MFDLALLAAHCPAPGRIHPSLAEVAARYAFTRNLGSDHLEINRQWPLLDGLCGYAYRAILWIDSLEASALGFF